MTELLHIVGRDGRIGRELVRLAPRFGFHITDDPDRCTVFIITTPPRRAHEYLANHPKGVTVIDMSGASKEKDLEHLTFVAPNENPKLHRGELYSNPGCMASAVVMGLKYAPIGRNIHVTCIGGHSMGPPDADGSITVGHQLTDHPHVAEIEMMTGIKVLSFTPVLAHGNERGLIATISGSSPTNEWGYKSDTPLVMDAKNVEYTDLVEHRLYVHSHPTNQYGFTVLSAIDNLTFPAANALRIVRSLK